jgi:hypothetical protein
MSTIRAGVTGRSGLPTLSALDLEKNISVREAAALKGVSYWTFKRHYSHLINKPSPNRETVKLRTLLEDEA